MFKKLRNSVMLFNLLTVTLVMFLAFTVIYLVTYESIEQENLHRLQAVSVMFLEPNRVMAHGFPDANIINTEPESGRVRVSVEYAVSFVLFVKDGRLEYVNSQLDLDESVYAEAFERAGAAQSGKVTLVDKKWMFAIAELPKILDGHTIIPENTENTRIVFLDVTRGAETLRSLLITLAAVGSGSLFALFWISYRFAVRVVRPIEDNYNRQKQFIADASHELRTPLAVISASVDAVTASGEESINSQKEWFDYIRAELKRTGKLVDDLLYLAKSESIRSESNLPFDLSTVCETVCASMEAVLYDCGKSLETDIAKNITVVADSEKISSMMYILLDNAGKYTPKNGHISVTLTRESDKAVLRVMNSGDGIAAADLPKIFDRFYRAEASRSTETGGSGLGLSIAKTIVVNSGGAITAESANGATTFTVKLCSQKS